jgi:hypothetical protein
MVVAEMDATNSCDMQTVAKQRMDEFDELDADLREFVRQTNDLMRARGMQHNRRFFESPAPHEGERLVRKRR